MTPAGISPTFPKTPDALSPAKARVLIERLAGLGIAGAFTYDALSCDRAGAEFIDDRLV